MSASDNKGVLSRGSPCLAGQRDENIPAAAGTHLCMYITFTLIRSVLITGIFSEGGKKPETLPLAAFVRRDINGAVLA